MPSAGLFGETFEGTDSIELEELDRVKPKARDIPNGRLHAVK
ncbi:MAG TPA: hypothetical protein VE977_07670 [Pyrinomonadaceae bacterium]|nr:hypothetical protein [Pyrinomonadaceae bacterium]